MAVPIGAMSGGKFGVYESPSHDRLLYVTTSLIGLPVDVQMKNGSIYSGIFHATSDEKEFGMFSGFLFSLKSCFNHSFYELVLIPYFFYKHKIL